MIGFLLVFFGVKSLCAQDFLTSPTGTVPSSFSPDAESNLLETLEGFAYSLNISSLYNSNIGLQENGGDGEFSVGVGANFSYRTAGDSGALWVGTLSYSPSFRQFFSDQDRPGTFAQSARALLSYSGPSVGASFGVSFSSGGDSNRLAGGFVDASRLGLNASVSWNYSPKTSLQINAGYNGNIFGGSSLGNSESVVFGGSLSWQATPLVNLGPFVNISETTSDNAGSLGALGFGLNIGYSLTGKTSLNGSLGLQSQSFGRGGGSTSFFGNVSLAWSPNEVYQVNFGLNTSTLSAPSFDNQFVNNYDLNLRVAREWGGGNLSVSSGLSFSNFESTGSALFDREDEQFVSLNVSYGRAIFHQEVSLNTSVGYRKGLGGREFSSAVISANLGYSF